MYTYVAIHQWYWFILSWYIRVVYPCNAIQILQFWTKCKIYPYPLYINVWGLVYIKKVDLFCHNTQMSSTPTPHQKITPSTSPHLPLHHPTPKYTYFDSKPTSYQPYITHTKPLIKSIHYLTSYTNSKT